MAWGIMLPGWWRRFCVHNTVPSITEQLQKMEQQFCKKMRLVLKKYELDERTTNQHEGNKREGSGSAPCTCSLARQLSSFMTRTYCFIEIMRMQVCRSL